MSDQHNSHDHTYDQARQAFSELDLEGRVTFLIKESVNTFVYAFEEVAQGFARECGTIFRPPGSARKAADPKDD